MNSATCIRVLKYVHVDLETMNARLCVQNAIRSPTEPDLKRKTVDTEVQQIS